MTCWARVLPLFWRKSTVADALRVLVTRPQGDACDSLCGALEAAGHEAYSQPLLKLEKLAQLSAQQRSLLQRLDEFQHIIFISGNAVSFGMELVEDTWPQLPVGLNWYAVGSATAGRLAAYGIDAVSPAEMSSEGLLNLPALQAVSEQRVLIVKGQGGRDTLRAVLSGRGAQVEELACYRRCPPALSREELLDRLLRWGIDIVLISSGEGLENLRLLLSRAETSKLNLIVPSERIARMARDGEFKRVTTAENASDAAMLRALEEWPHCTGE